MMPDISITAPTLVQRRAAKATNLSGILVDGKFTAVLASGDYLDDPLNGPVALSMEPGAAVERETTPLRVEHQGAELPAGVVRNVRAEGGLLLGDVSLSNRLIADGTAKDIADGLITDLSINASVLAYEETAEGILATSWRANEYSLVGEGKDPKSQIIRSAKMPETKIAPVSIDTKVRSTEIAALFSGLDGPEFIELERNAHRSEDTIDVIRSQVMEALKAKATPVISTSTIQSGADHVDKVIEGISRSISLSTSTVAYEDRKGEQAKHNASELRGQSLLELARSYLRSVNYDVSGLSRDELARRALFVSRSGIVGHAAGDFANLLADNVNKALARGYEEAPETWAAWTGRDSAPDFKENKRPLMSAFSDLDEIPTDGGYNYGTFSDKAESFTLGTYGKLFSIGRKAITNDDLSAFGRIPRAMGRAASRKVGDEVYSVLTTGKTTTMGEDSVALFASAHGNFVDSGAAPSVTTLSAAWVSMGTQTEPGGHTIQIAPKNLIVPLALQPSSDVLVRAVNNPAIASGVEPMPGFIGDLSVVGEARLDSDSSAAWYLAADAAFYDTVLVAFLDGVETPMIEEQAAPIDRDGVIYKVRHDFTAYPGDYRGLYRNDGE